MLTRFAILVVLPAALQVGCSRPVLKPGSTSLKEFSVQCSRNQVFDETLRVAQRRNLEVKVLEKSSGFIRFERTALGPDDLDQYCVFPLVSPKTGVPVSTFQDWGSTYGVPAVGTVNLNILLSEAPPNATSVSIRGNWSVGARGEGVPVSSTGVFESEVEADLASSAVCGTPKGAVDPEKLQRLRGLLDRGLISTSEFEQKKRALEME